jgi:DNA-binding MarR family transcriptional regulator
MENVTIYDVAERAGVSIKTVSRVLNDQSNVQPENSRRVFEAMSALSFRPDPSAARNAATPADGRFLEGWSNLLGFNVGMAQLAVERDFAHALADFDLSQRQFTVLRLIERNSGLSQADIAGLLGSDRASVFAVVDDLQERGLLERGTSSHEGRAQELNLTREGETFVRLAAQAVAAHDHGIAERFTPQELDLLLDALRRLQRPS